MRTRKGLDWTGKFDAIAPSRPENEEKVVDLMEALKRSLKGGGGPSREKADRLLRGHARRAKPKGRKTSRTNAA